MSADIATARDQIAAVFKAAWDPTGFPAIYQDVKQEKPAAGTTWARLTIQHSGGFQATLSGETGNRRFRRVGIGTVQIFTPFGDGLDSSDALAKIVHEAFEGVTTTSGVIFRDVATVEVGIDGPWWNTNVTFSFEYDKIR